MSAAAPNTRLNASGPGGGARFPRSLRLLRHSDFELVYKEGRRHFAAHMTVFYRRRAQGEGIRVGFTVSKALGGAVIRNRMKRRLREAVRLHFPTTQVPLDVVINPKASVLKVDFSGLGSEISRAFEVIQKSTDAKTT